MENGIKDGEIFIENAILTSANAFKSFKIDWSKITTLETVIEVLKAMNLIISYTENEIPVQFKYLIENNLLIPCAESLEA